MSENDLEGILELMCHEGDLQRAAIIRNAIDLVNRQQAEIEAKEIEYNEMLEQRNSVEEHLDRLQGELIEERTRRDNAVNAYHEARAEIDSLKRQLHNSKLHEKECCKALKNETRYRDHDTKMIKNEAIKAFAERLKLDLGYAFLQSHNCVVSIIDNLVKEMVGELK